MQQTDEVMGILPAHHGVVPDAQLRADAPQIPQRGLLARVGECPAGNSRGAFVQVGVDRELHEAEAAIHERLQERRVGQQRAIGGHADVDVPARPRVSQNRGDVASKERLALHEHDGIDSSSPESLEIPPDLLLARISLPRASALAAEHARLIALRRDPRHGVGGRPADRPRAHSPTPGPQEMRSARLGPQARRPRGNGTRSTILLRS
jgi:hypothetical protein